MNAGKRRRYEYRKAIKRLGPADRFEDMMRAVGVGTASCISCTLVRVREDLDEHLVCVVCRAGRGARPRPITHRPYAAAQLEPDTVYTDASYRHGIGGLAIVGALGEHSDCVDVSSNTHAEVLAMQWAFRIAKNNGFERLTFRTDSLSALNWGTNAAPAGVDWKVEWIPRKLNAIADRVASGARLGGRDA